MRTLLSFANHWSKIFPGIFLLFGLLFGLASCNQDSVTPTSLIDPVTDPVETYVGSYQVTTSQCPEPEAPLVIRPYAGFTPQNGKKMISISNLGILYHDDVTAVWKDNNFVIESQKVANGGGSAVISGELRLEESKRLTVWYSIETEDKLKPCTAEYRKY